MILRLIDWHRVLPPRPEVHALLAAPMVTVGIVLPLDFIARVDGYLHHLRPWELLPVYAWASLFYGVLGLSLSAAILIPVLLAACMTRQSLVVWACRTSVWLSLSLIAYTAIKCLRLWLEAVIFPGTSAWLTPARWALFGIVSAGCAVWSWRHLQLPNDLSRVAAVGVAGALAVAVIALPATWLADRSLAVHAGTTGSRIDGPHIVLITIDTLSANHASVYGYRRQTTPYLEQLAQQATVFERFYANGNWTAPCVNSFMNGVRPWTHRALQSEAKVAVSIADQGLVARLKRVGYQTFAVATNPIAAPYQNLSDRHLDVVSNGNVRESWAKMVSLIGPEFPRAVPASSLGPLPRLLPLSDSVLVRSGIWSKTDHFDPEFAFSAARRLVETRRPDRPLFLWIHLFPPHYPYATPPPFSGRFDPSMQGRTRFDSTPPLYFAAGREKDFPGRYIGRYDESVNYVDHHIGRFLEWLKDQKLYTGTLLIVSADHGESFSHGYGAHGGPMLLEDVIRLPLVIKEPEQRTGQRLDVLAEQIDLMPTVLDLAGIPAAGVLEGRSLKPAMRGAKMSGPVFSMDFEQSKRFGRLDTGVVAMLDEHWKYVHYVGNIRGYPHMPTLEDALYNLQTDPGEHNNLVRAHPEVVTRMRAEIGERLQRHGGPIQ